MTVLPRAMPRLAILALPLLLAGCSRDHTVADLQKCVATATPNYPADGTMTDEERHDAIGADVKDCMRDAGYRQDTGGEKCLDDLEFNPACYVRKRS